jgi:hypothetical protein
LDITHIPGKEMESQMHSQDRVNTSNDNLNQIVLPKRMFSKKLTIKEDLWAELEELTSNKTVMDEHFITIWKILKNGRDKY